MEFPDTKTARLARLSGRLFLVLLGVALLCGLAAYLQSSALQKWLSGLAANATFSDIYGLWPMVLVLWVAELVLAGVVGYVLFRWASRYHETVAGERLTYWSWKSPYSRMWDAVRKHHREVTAAVARSNRFIHYWLMAWYAGLFGSLLFVMLIFRIHQEGYSQADAASLYLYYLFLAFAQFFILVACVTGWRMVSKFTDILLAIKQGDA